MATDQSYLWTSECVGEGHPDKVADQISDAVLDACLEQDPKSRVACETLVKDEHVVLAGEITTNATVSFDHIVSNALSSIGYDYEPKVLNLLSQQSNEISQAVGDFDGAGDQGIMFGYATSETPTYMPLTMYLARDVSNMLTSNRLAATEIGKFLLPDCKTQVSVRFNSDGSYLRLTNVLEGGTAQQAGLSAGDLIVAIDGLRPGSAGLDAALRGRRVGERVRVHAFRRDELRQFEVRLAAAPADTAELHWDDLNALSKKSIKSITYDAISLRRRWLGQGA